MSVFFSRSPRIPRALTFSQGGSPLLQQGELDFSPAKKRCLLRKGFSPGIFCSRILRAVLTLTHARRDDHRFHLRSIPPRNC